VTELQHGDGEELSDDQVDLFESAFKLHVDDEAEKMRTQKVSICWLDPCLVLRVKADPNVGTHPFSLVAHFRCEDFFVAVKTSWRLVLQEQR